VILAHKVALDPTQAQAEYFARACGVARFAWNWGLARWRQEYALWREYRCGPKPSEAALRRELNALKADAFPWMREVTKNAPQQAIKNLGTAFKNFFEGRARYPTFKRKGRANDSFRADPGTDKDHPNAVEVDGRRVKLPVIGWVRMREAPRFEGPIKSATVSRVADRWFASLSVEVDHAPPARETQAVGGVDLGVKAMATLSDGTALAGPMALRKNLKKLRRLSRALSRKAKGSANRRKAAARLARLHARIANVRRDALHKATHGGRAPLRCGRHRRPERARHDGERPAGPRHRGRRRVRVPPAAGIQGGDARRAHRGRGPLVPVQPDVQRVRGHPRRADAGGPGVGLRWLRRGPRPRPQRGDQPERPRGEFRRDSLWSGRLWPRPRGQGETSRDEAGT
jgi:probable transposase/helix-turn-helix protein